MTFHTLERVKAEVLGAASDDRAHQEAAILACADAVLASCDVEAEQFVRLYHADRARVHVVPLGVEHAFFAPGHRPQARRALGVDPTSTHVALRRSTPGAQGRRPGARHADRTVPSRPRRARWRSSAGRRGPTVAPPSPSCTIASAAAGVIDRVSFVAPQAHQLLSTWMRAADVTLVPSRSESFGLVALESSACGTPVVASDVGGLSTLVEPGVNGVLLAEPRRRAPGPTRSSGSTDPRHSTAPVDRRRAAGAALHLARGGCVAGRPGRGAVGVEPGALLSESRAAARRRRARRASTR